MATRTIPALAFAGLMTASVAFAAQPIPANEADVCALPAPLADAGDVKLAALFTNSDADRDKEDLFSDAPLLIYAMNEVARESDGVMLVDVSGVTSCVAHKTSI